MVEKSWLMSLMRRAGERGDAGRGQLPLPCPAGLLEPWKIPLAEGRRGLAERPAHGVGQPARAAAARRAPVLGAPRRRAAKPVSSSSLLPPYAPAVAVEEIPTEERLNARWIDVTKSNVMRHCVASYATQAATGWVQILHATTDGKPLAVMAERQGGKLRVIEAAGMCNRPPTPRESDVRCLWNAQASQYGQDDSGEEQGDHRHREGKPWKS